MPIKACFNAKDFYKILQEQGIPKNVVKDSLPLERGVAETHSFALDGTGITLVIVVFDLPELSKSAVQMAGTIAHEAIHVTERILEYVGENKNEFGEESRAYLTQCLVEQIFDAACNEIIKDEKRAKSREQVSKPDKSEGGSVLEVDIPEHDRRAGSDSAVPGDPSGGVKRPRGRTVRKTKEGDNNAGESGNYGERPVLH